MSKTLLVEIRNIAIGVIILGAVQVLVTLPTKFFGLSAIFEHFSDVRWQF